MGRALRLVGVQQVGRSLATDDRIQFPSQIEGVAYARTHALTEEGRRLVRRVARQHQAAFAPAFGNDGVKGVDDRALYVGMLGPNPARQQRPQVFWLDHLFGHVTRHQHDFPAAAVAGDVAIGHGPRRVAMLHGVTWQLGRSRLEQGIEHQPGLVQPQVFHGCVQGFAHQGARAIAAHHIAGQHGVMGVMHTIGHRQLNAVAPLFQVADLTRQAHLHRRKT